jgi:hypothetical protein
MKLAEYAPGIPDKKTKHEIPKVKTPAVWEFGIHKHLAEKAGEHFDLRLGDPDTGHAHSWAMRHWPEPGEVRLAVQQPTHTIKYMDFKGEIPEGYGKGKVELARRDKTEVISSSSGHIRFNVYPGNRVEEYLLRRPAPDSDQWMLHYVTSSRSTVEGAKLPSSKPAYKVKTPEKVNLEDPNTVLQAKIDGAHVLYQFKDTGRQARVLSYRPTERKTGVIEHTQKLPDFAEKKVPSALRGTILRGELYATDAKGQALPSERVGGLLNAGVWKSREKQEAVGKLVPTVFDVVQWRGKDVSNAPYAEKLELLREATKAAPWLKLPRTAETPEEKKRLFEDIKSGKEPSTQEGVIEWSKDKPVPIKAKFRPEADVYVKDVFHEKSTRGMAGGFTYSKTPGGPVAGRVGTGMSHALKKDLATRPEKYKDLHALITVTRGHEGRAPAFKGWHLEQEFPEGVKMAGRLLPP